MLGEYCGGEEGQSEHGYSSLLRQPQIIQPAFPSGDAGSTPKDSTNFGSNQSYWKKKILNYVCLYLLVFFYCFCYLFI